MREHVEQMADEAAYILKSEVFGAAFLAVDTRIVASWRDAKTPEARETLYMEQKALNNIRRELLAYLEDAQKMERAAGDTDRWHWIIQNFKKQFNR